jgi:hypothetical protein
VRCFLFSLFIVVVFVLINDDDDHQVNEYINS